MKLFVAFLFVIILLSTGCNEQRATTDREQARATEQMVAQAQQTVGMPNIVNWNQRRQVKELYELLDREGLTTYSYIVDMNGRFIFLCESIGYGIPASVQFTNPQRLVGNVYQGGAPSMPQPEPNGLFMPEGLSATYVNCLHEGAERVVYVEPQVVVSPFPIQ